VTTKSSFNTSKNKVQREIPCPQWFLSSLFSVYIENFYGTNKNTNKELGFGGKIKVQLV